MDAVWWGLALFGTGLGITVVAATQVGTTATALFALGLPAMLAGVVLLESARRASPNALCVQVHANIIPRVTEALQCTMTLYSPECAVGVCPEVGSGEDAHSKILSARSTWPPSGAQIRPGSSCV
jgi:hypothetical protein